MLTESSSKVSADHLRRDAFLYVRQSSLRQVVENTESTQRQYALRDRAVALGWPLERIHVIDCDLGRSGAHAQDRDGFQHLVAEVAMGHAGLVLGLEVSRLARNNADWHRLIELAALAHTLILDEDGIYDPAHFNDRLLLGLKGAMSEAELHVLKARLQGGIRNKARRGELALALPIGLVYGADGKVALDPDRQIQETVRLLFTTFRDGGSAAAVVRRFAREGWRFPRRIRRGIGQGDVVWGALEHSRVIQILHNPRYAGAFVYGRTCGGLNPQFKPIQRRVACEQWPVLIRDVHPGYIDWAEYERNQRTLAQNEAGFGVARRGSVPRAGVGLLQGRVVCGRCGARMRVRYQEVAGHLEPYYQCAEAAVRRAGPLCQSVRGKPVDEAISALLLETLVPAALEAALAVQDEIAGRIAQAEALRRSQLERARYAAELARRRYLHVDPDHRLVADALEADWNEQLRQLDALQREHERQRGLDQDLLGAEARGRILALATEFQPVWQDPGTAPIERKRIVALLIEDVTLVKADQVFIHVRFRGGQTQSLVIDKPQPIALIRKTRPEVVARLDQLLDHCSDDEAALRLNAEGHRNWKHEPFTAKKVSVVRHAYGLTSRFQRLRAQGFLTAEELAEPLGVCATTLYQWGRDGLLQTARYGNGKRCLFAPLAAGEIIVKGQGSKTPRPPQRTTLQSTT
jgi:DNA invertase Pin-like site-specific DNA recombinase/DNA-binding XRE family transcriptional regulator